MLNVNQILVSTIGLAVLGVGLMGCGQRGPLYLPTDPAAANRATLPQVLLPIPTRQETTVIVPDAQQPSGQPATDSPASGSGTNNNTNNNSNPTGTAR